MLSNLPKPTQIAIELNFNSHSQILLLTTPTYCFSGHIENVIEGTIIPFTHTFPESYYWVKQDSPLQAV